MKAILLALAVVAITARLLRRRHPAPLPQYDDSEVVGMPTRVDNSWTLGPGWYVELAPTSRN